MISVPDLAELVRPEGIGRHIALVPLGEINAYLDRFPPREEWSQHLIKHCQCCGERPALIQSWGVVRCVKHVDRNPCLVEGCTRTGKAEGQLANDQLICGPHWREFVPAGSPQRRIYNRFFRRAKKHGWTDQSINAFHRYWRSLVSHVRAKARGDVDMDEVNRLMGWS